MDILVAGVTLGALVFVLFFIGTILLTIGSFLYAQTLLLKAAFAYFKAPHALYHPLTQQILSGHCPELKLAQEALARGDTPEAHRLIQELIFMLDAEPNKAMRSQLKRKLAKAIQ